MSDTITSKSSSRKKTITINLKYSNTKTSSDHCSDRLKSPPQNTSRRRMRSRSRGSSRSKDSPHVNGSSSSRDSCPSKSKRPAPDSRLDRNRPEDLNVFNYGDIKRLKRECLVLGNENEILKSSLMKFSIAKNDVTAKAPIDVIFRNEDLRKRYQQEIELFITNLLSRDSIWNSSQSQSSPLAAPDRETTRNNWSHAAVGIASGNTPISHQNSPCGFPPRSPTLLAQSNEHNEEFGDILGDKVGNEKPAERKKVECYNCGGEHVAYMCPSIVHPDEIKRIAKSRQERYHSVKIQNSEGESYKRGEPGKISKTLQRALNLRSSQVPLYIYRMRILGYPPGWLEETAFNKSGLKFCGLDPKDEKEKQNDEPDSLKDAYDLDKLISYPGFNTPLSTKYIDDAQMLGYPEYQPNQLFSVMDSQNNVSKLNPSYAEKRLEVDMEIESEDENFIPPLPPTEQLPPPPPPTEQLTQPPLPPPNEMPSSPKEEFNSSSCHEDCTEVSNLTSKNSFLDRQAVAIERNVSPSLNELEEEKRKLLMALCDSDSNEVEPGSESGSDKKTEAPDKCEPNEMMEQASTLQDSKREHSEEEKKMEEKVPEQLTHSPISVSFGSPSVPIFSKFKKLPLLQDFSSSVEEYLPYETTNERTGTYSKMKDLLKKAKRT